MPQNHVLRVLTPVEDEFGIKKLLRGQPEGLRPSTLKLGLMGFSDMRNTKIKMKNLYAVLLRVYASIFGKKNIQICPSTSKLGM